MESKRWGILALCSIFLMSVAVLYAWSVFSAALENRQGWTRLETSGIFTLSMTAYCGGSLVSGFLARYWSTKKMLRSAAALLAAGFMIAGFWPAVGGVSLGYGVLCGCGVDTAVLLIGGMVLLGISYSGMSSLCAASVRELFGTRHYSENISIMSLQVIVSSALGPLLCGITYTRWKSYELVCGGLLLLSLIGLLLAATMPGKICGRVNVQK